MKGWTEKQMMQVTFPACTQQSAPQVGRRARRQGSTGSPIPPTGLGSQHPSQGEHLALLSGTHCLNTCVSSLSCTVLQVPGENQLLARLLSEGRSHLWPVLGEKGHSMLEGTLPSSSSLHVDYVCQAAADPGFLRPETDTAWEPLRTRVHNHGYKIV